MPPAGPRIRRKRRRKCARLDAERERDSERRYSPAKQVRLDAQGSRRCLFAALCTYREMNQVSASKPGRCLLLTRRGPGTPLFPPSRPRPFVFPRSFDLLFFLRRSYIAARKPPSACGSASKLLPLSFAPLRLLSEASCSRNVAIRAIISRENNVPRQLAPEVTGVLRFAAFPIVSHFRGPPLRS